MSNPSKEMVLTTDLAGVVDVLGKKLYGQKVQVIRELIQNAYDADATRVEIITDEKSLMVRDNGEGMTFEELEGYFKIAGDVKRRSPVSSKFKRQRIGEFGIGKLSSFGVCDIFRVTTRKRGEKLAYLLDIKKLKDTDKLTAVKGGELSEDGTEIALFNLHKKFTDAEVERVVRQMPLQNNFRVFLNGKEILPEKEIAGLSFTISESVANLGSLEGRAIFAEKPLPLQEAGLKIRVKGVQVGNPKLFGLESYGHGVNRLTGWVSADFLPLTAGRDGFIEDSVQYKEFNQKVRDLLRTYFSRFQATSDKRFSKENDDILREIVKRFRRFFREEPDLAPTTPVWTSRGHRRGIESEESLAHVETKPHITDEEHRSPSIDRGGHRDIPHATVLTSPEEERTAGTKYVLSEQRGITVRCRPLGPDEPEVVLNGSLVEINTAHPLFPVCAPKGKRETKTVHMARLISAIYPILMNVGEADTVLEHQRHIFGELCSEEIKLRNGGNTLALIEGEVS